MASSPPTKNRLSPLVDFKNAIDKALVDTSFEAFASCREPFDKLARHSFAVELINSHLREFLSNETSYPAFVKDGRLLLLQEENYSLDLALMQPKPSEAPETIVSSLCEHSMIACLGPGTITYDRFFQPAPEPNDELDRSKVLTRISQRISCTPLAEPDVFRAGYDLYFVHPLTEAALALRLSTGMLYKLRWDYDLATLAPIRASSADLSESRLEFAARLIAELGDADNLAGLTALAEHPSHFVRWAAMQSALRVDPAGGAKLITAALSDEHPHVRRAAARTLERYPELSEPDPTSQTTRSGGMAWLSRSI